MPKNPKLLTNKVFPGLGDQHEVGLANVGFQVVETTMNANPASIPTDANIVAALSNNAAGNMSYGPIVHSFGTTPSLAFAMLAKGNAAPSWMVNFAFITADNSAVYIKPQSYTGGPTALPVRIIIIR
jgi:hypothetical protein